MKRAVILAGGLGTRLRPYTVALPKPLMPIGQYPILEVIIRQLCAKGFGHITLAVNHQADLFKAFFGDGSKWGIRIDYSLESKPLGTMGPLRLIPDLPDDFLVMNGDILSDVDYGQFLDRHVVDRDIRFLTFNVSRGLTRSEGIQARLTRFRPSSFEITRIRRIVQTLLKQISAQSRLVAVSLKTSILVRMNKEPTYAHPATTCAHTSEISNHRRQA